MTFFICLGDEELLLCLFAWGFLCFGMDSSDSLDEKTFGRDFYFLPFLVFFFLELDLRSASSILRCFLPLLSSFDVFRALPLRLLFSSSLSLGVLLRRERPRDFFSSFSFSTSFLVFFETGSSFNSSSLSVFLLCALCRRVFIIQFKT